MRVGFHQQSSASQLGTRPPRGRRSIARRIVATIALLGVGTSMSLDAAKAPTPANESIRMLEFREPHPQRYFLDTEPFETDDPPFQEEGLPARFGSPSGPEVLLTKKVVLHTKDPIEEASLLQRYYLRLNKRVQPNLAILEAVDPTRAFEAALRLNQSENTLACYPVMKRHYSRRSRFAPSPNDTYVNQAWHVENRDSNGQRLGIDMNLRSAWAHTQGKGITVALSDNGIDLNHPDLVSRAARGPHFNFGDNQASGGFINSDAHGTAVAGVIAAEGNNQTGVIGVAPQSNLSSLVVFDVNRRGREGIVSDDRLMDMFEFEIDQIDVQNHSWGSVAEQQSGIDALSDAGIQRAIERGRSGKGVVMVRAAGNEREFLQNANDDGFAGDPRVIAVAAVRFDGNVASYSSPGACILVSAPSGDDAFPGVATTDHQGSDGYVTRGRGDLADYLLGDAGFAGTSASSPIIAGIAALILSQNPELTYRDVQQILIHSARQTATRDPDVTQNAAGLSFSHNTGYGVPDAGFAVQLASLWKPRPDAIEIVDTVRPNRAIPDAGLEVSIRGSSVPFNIRQIAAHPSLGPFADRSTDTIPLQFVGEATDPIRSNLSGKAALIRRGENTFEEKIEHAHQAGAEFVIIYNNRDFDEVPRLGGTEFSPIPAVSINQRDGEALLNYIDSQPSASAAITLRSANVEFDVSETLLTEHVGVQISTTHSYRGDLRITLTSPHGTRSILQAANNDSTPGPRGWTYWSTKHFYESSAGTWTLSVTDQDETDTGSITSASLIINGVPILDIDHDGLDDQWERLSFGSINFGPKADPDEDGFNNAREQIFQTNPTRSDRPLRINLGLWNPNMLRLSWPSEEDSEYQLWRRTSLGGAPQLLETIDGSFPTSDIILPIRSTPFEYFEVKQSR